MERTEPTLVPEWLKFFGGGSNSHPDDHSLSRLDRNKQFVYSNGHDFGRSSSFERTASSYFRHSSSSNGSGNNLRPYSSFGRNNRDRDWEKDSYDSRGKDRLFWGNTLSTKFERDGLRRSQSMISGKRGETWPKKVMNGPINGSGNGTNSGLLSTGRVVKKASFERDFPSLGAEEREVGLFPGLSSAIQSLTIGTSATIGGEKWTSALAEVPIRAQTAPQLSYGTQRLEELAIKQSRQLIPVTPSMPKTLTSSSSDKQKSRANPIYPQHHPISSSLTLNHSPRGGPVKGDVSKPSNFPSQREKRMVPPL